jgi:hypothetical protein
MREVVVVLGISIQLTLSVLYCHDMYTVPLPPFALEVKVTVLVPLHPVCGEGFKPRFIGAPTWRRVTLVMAVAQLLLKTALYFQPSWLVPVLTMV